LGGDADGVAGRALVGLKGPSHDVFCRSYDWRREAGQLQAPAHPQAPILPSNTARLSTKAV
jgi:hypothetical protein